MEHPGVLGGGTEKGYGSVTHSTYLIFDRKRIIGMRLGKPSLRGGQFAVKIVLVIPDAIFKEEPPTATLTIPERAVFTPEVTVAVDPSLEDATEGRTQGI